MTVFEFDTGRSRDYFRRTLMNKLSFVILFVPFLFGSLILNAQDFSGTWITDPATIKSDNEKGKSETPVILSQTTTTFGYKSRITFSCALDGSATESTSDGIGIACEYKKINAAKVELTLVISPPGSTPETLQYSKYVFELSADGKRLSMSKGHKKGTNVVKTHRSLVRQS